MSKGFDLKTIKKWIFKITSEFDDGSLKPGCRRWWCRNIGRISDDATITRKRLHLLGLIVCHLLSAMTTILAAKDIPTYHMTAFQGDPVYMPCNISTSEDDAVVIVLWYREDLGTPVYTVDLRDRSILQADKWSADNVFAKRAYFISDKVPAELGVDHIRESDAGMYRCRVDFRKAQTRNTRVNLTVIVPPQRLVILDEFGIEKTSIVGPYSEGSDLLLTCDVYGGNPAPTVIWWRDKQKVGKITSSTGSLIRSEVFLRNLGRDDLHSALTCNAFNNNKTLPLSATVHIEMNFPPMNVKILVTKKSLSAGRSYDLLCQSFGSRPSATLSWWKDEKRLEKAKETISNDGNITVSTLSFVPFKEDNGKYITCRSKNPILAGSELENKWKMQIQYVPECRIELGKSLNRNAVKEGSDVYFDCIISAEPPVHKVEWRHNSRELHHNVGQGIIVSNQSLVLQGVSRSSAGKYSCTGYNSEGETESNFFYLNVLHVPTCKPNQIRVYGIAKSEKASISCSVEANPSDVTFRWVFNNSAESIDLASSQVTQSEMVSVVSYIPRTEMDYGTLLCWARNSVGDQQVPCVFHIIAAGRPDPVLNCTVSNVSATSLSIKCTEGFSGGLPQSFFLELLKANTQEIEKNTTSPFPRFVVENLEAGIDYKILVYAFNLKGRSEPIVLQASTPQMNDKEIVFRKEQQKIMNKMTFTITAVVAGGAILSMVATVALILRIRCYKVAKRKLLKVEHESVGKGIGKVDESFYKLRDGEEKNPDVVPHPDAMEYDHGINYMMKRQHISTIEASSPDKSLSVDGFRDLGAQKCCNIRRVRLGHESHFHHSKEMSYACRNCKVPRYHWEISSGSTQENLTDVDTQCSILDNLNPIPAINDHSDISIVKSKVESTV